MVGRSYKGSFASIISITLFVLPLTSGNIRVTYVNQIWESGYLHPEKLDGKNQNIIKAAIVEQKDKQLSDVQDTNGHQMLLGPQQVVEMEPHPQELFARIIQQNDIHPTPFNYVLNATANDIMDDLITTIKDKLASVLDLPDVDVSLKKGYFKAWKGWLNGINDIYRTSDANIIINQQQDSFTVSSITSMPIVHYGYSAYKSKYSILKFKGKMNGFVKNNAATVQITMNVSEKNCSTVLDAITNGQFDEINISLTGLGIWKKAVMKRINNVIRQRKNQIISEAQSMAFNQFKDILAMYDCSKFFRRTDN